MSEYYSVTEYAQLTGKDTGNIRRLLINGTLHGEKLGNQWIIPKDEAFPADKRIKNGNYKNWRKSVSVNKTNPVLMKSLKEMCQKLHSIYGLSLDRIILYGSYSRGEQTEESDVDIALLLKDGNTEEMHDKMVNVVVDYELDLDLTLSVVPIDYDQFHAWKKTLPFYKNIDKEGIILWKSA